MSGANSNKISLVMYSFENKILYYFQRKISQKLIVCTNLYRRYSLHIEETSYKEFHINEPDCNLSVYSYSILQA